MEWSFSLAESADTYFGLPSFPRWLILLTAAHCGTRLKRENVSNDFLKNSPLMVLTASSYGSSVVYPR